MRFIDIDERVLVSFAPIEAMAHFAVDPLEQASLGVSVVPKRRREFHAGRAMARQLLQMSGFRPAPIPMQRNRLPAWPNGVVASISHTDTHVAVAISRSSDVLSVGIDIEREGAVETALFPRILSAGELDVVKSRAANATEFFSAKEAAFKACFSIHQEYFDFTDVTIEFERDGFRCTPITTLASADALDRGSGRLIGVDAHIISLFCAMHP